MTHPPRKYNAWCTQILRRFAPLKDNMAEGTIRLRKIKKRLEGSPYSSSTLKNSSSRISNASSTFQNCCWSVRRRNYFRFKYENTLHSLHEYDNSLSINVSACNVLVFYMSLMSLFKASDISDIWFFLSLHGETLRISALRGLCNECNEIMKVVKKNNINFCY